jgi:NAD(P)-dependent dehydrogenase (short-subunit alcohol dehydrogenase family)
MHCVVADVTNEAAVEALFTKGFDVVVANAGVGRAAPLAEVSLEEWNETLAVNLTGTFLTFRAALRSGMPEGGRLIAVASTQALKGGGRIAAYAASKHGVLGLVRSVAQEVAKKGITCNAICPGFVDTPMADAAVQNMMEARGLERAAAEKMVVSGNPVGRIIAVDEVASAALYLASKGAAMVNGHALSVSGGEI